MLTDSLCFNFTIANPNKNKNNNNKKKMENYGCFIKCQKLLIKQLSAVPAIVRITKQHLKDILKGF